MLRLCVCVGLKSSWNEYGGEPYCFFAGVLSFLKFLLLGSVTVSFFQFLFLCTPGELNYEILGWNKIGSCESDHSEFGVKK